MQIEWSKCMRKGEFRLRNLSQSLLYYNSFRTTPRSFSRVRRCAQVTWGTWPFLLRGGKRMGPCVSEFRKSRKSSPRLICPGKAFDEQVQQDKRTRQQRGQGPRKSVSRLTFYPARVERRQERTTAVSTAVLLMLQRHESNTRLSTKLSGTMGIRFRSRLKNGRSL